MKRLFLICFLFFYSCTPIIDTCRPLFEIGAFSDLKYYDRSARYAIYLKCKRYDDWTSEDRVTLGFSYQIHIFSPLSEEDGMIYLRLLDSEGYQVAHIYLSHMVKGYFGTLKGSFILDGESALLLSNAELDYRLPLK